MSSGSVSCAMMRFIRLLGGALGVILAIVLADISDALGSGSPEGQLLLLVWIAAWGIMGFAIMPYITVVPARWLLRAVTDMSTDEFVAAVAWLAELFPEPRRREAVLGTTQAFSSLGGLMVTGASCTSYSRPRVTMTR